MYIFAGREEDQEHTRKRKYMSDDGPASVGGVKKPRQETEVTETGCSSGTPPDAGNLQRLIASDMEDPDLKVLALGLASCSSSMSEGTKAKLKLEERRLEYKEKKLQVKMEMLKMKRNEQKPE